MEGGVHVGARLVTQEPLGDLERDFRAVVGVEPSLAGEVGVLHDLGEAENRPAVRGIRGDSLAQRHRQVNGVRAHGRCPFCAGRAESRTALVLMTHSSYSCSAIESGTTLAPAWVKVPAGVVQADLVTDATSVTPRHSKIPMAPANGPRGTSSRRWMRRCASLRGWPTVAPCGNSASTAA